MNVVLLSGGSGKRLWPLSNDIRSKQFLKLFKTEEGYQSMVQRIYGQIRSVDDTATVTIATGKTQVSAIRNQLGGAVNICVEPCRRDTFPAIALATAYLHDVVGLSQEETVVVCPVDPYVDDDYFRVCAKLGERAAKSDANLVLMGIEPTYPSDKYGYIIPENNAAISRVKTFKEKPTVETAKGYLAEGALWNGGVFAFRVGYLLKKAHELIAFDDYHDLYARYDQATKISFDYAVVENEEKIEVMRYVGKWKDLGTWNTLTEALDERAVGHVIMNETCDNLHVINELKIPILCMGLKDCIVAASSDGILVADKEQSGNIKPYVDGIAGEIMFSEKSWGSYRVMDIEKGSMTVFVTVKAGEAMSYHCHETRNEVWTVVGGTGRVTLDGKVRSVTVGDVITVPAGCRHRIEAVSELSLIEVQIGDTIRADDKIKFSLDN